jgi:hypothetical protein
MFQVLQLINHLKRHNRNMPCRHFLVAQIRWVLVFLTLTNSLHMRIITLAVATMI